MGLAMKPRTLWIFRCATVLLALACAFRTLDAQVLYGSLTGNVTDPSSAAVPGAKVTALNIDTGLSREATTDDRGAYQFANVQSGPYKVSVTAPSFQTTAQTDVRVNANEVRRVDFGLKIAQTSETVEVSTAAAILQTDKSDVHSEISSQQVVELPYSGGEGKNFQSLLYLVPGAGIPATREANSEAGNPQGAAGGAAINVAIKSGTNQYHGVVFERNQNNEMTAVNYFSHTAPLNKNIFNQYGFAFGGPIWIPKIVHGKNKLFFFLDYQGTKRRQYASTTNLTLPNTAMRAGDFSATGVTIYDPLTGSADGTGRTPFLNNTVPTNRIDPAAAILTGLLPALTRATAYTSNYDAYGNTQYNRTNWDFKVNYNPNDKLMIWGRYSLSPMDIVALLVLGPVAGGTVFRLSVGLGPFVKPRPPFGKVGAAVKILG